MQTVGSFLTEWTTAERNGDTGTLETLLTGDFTAVGSLGFILPKPAWLARHRQGDLTYQSFGLAEVQTRVLGGAAVVTARNNIRSSYQGHPLPEALRATLALVSDAGRWQLAAIHRASSPAPLARRPSPGGSCKTHARTREIHIESSCSGHWPGRRGPIKTEAVGRNLVPGAGRELCGDI